MIKGKLKGLRSAELVDFCRRSLGIQESIKIEIFPLERRGSDRSFYRLRWNENESAILIYYNPNREENNLYVEIAKFLMEIKIPVPKIINYDTKRYLILIEDIGEKTLYSLKDEPWEKREIFYQKTLYIISKLHSFKKNGFPYEHLKLMDDFDSNLYQCEQEYFKENFIKDFCKIRLDPHVEKAFENELINLRNKLLKISPTLIHRDLQSQNIMIRNEEVLLIDFQGMRFGNPFYDLGSLLLDPYVEISQDKRIKLLSYYYSLVKKEMDWKVFEENFWLASAQRLMQALGAYCFLGLKKGLKVYIKYIPAALENLYLVTSMISYLPLLKGLCLMCKK